MRPVYRFITTNDEYIVTLVEKGGSFAAFFASVVYCRFRWSAVFRIRPMPRRARP